MKLVCKHEKCGTVIQTGPEDTELAKKLLADHVEKEHGKIEDKFALVLAHSFELASDVSKGLMPTRKAARALCDEISSLTGKPLALPEKEEETKDGTQVQAGDCVSEGVS